MSAQEKAAGLTAVARYLGPVCRLCRREGLKLYLKGPKCYTPKCPFEKRPFPPGQGAQATQRRRRTSDYALRLREKQKLRSIYGVLERQFRRYFREAQRQPGHTGQTLLQLLETRLDNVVYRLGFGVSRTQARQLVRHGHIQVDGRRVDIPSYQVRPGQVVQVAPSSGEHPAIQAATGQARRPPAWLSQEDGERAGRIVSLPTRDQIDTPVAEHLIIEYYAR